MDELVFDDADEPAHEDDGKSAPTKIFHSPFPPRYTNKLLHQLEERDLLELADTERKKMVAGTNPDFTKSRGIYTFKHTTLKNRPPESVLRAFVEVPRGRTPVYHMSWGHDIGSLRAATNKFPRTRTVGNPLSCMRSSRRLASHRLRQRDENLLLLQAPWLFHGPGLRRGIVRVCKVLGCRRSRYPAPTPSASTATRTTSRPMFTSSTIGGPQSSGWIPWPPPTLAGLPRTGYAR